MNGGSYKWNRDTPWRQGHVLTKAAVQKLGLVYPDKEPELTYTIVISHDCDLVNDDLDKEPDAEVIIGKIVDKADGNFSWAKSPRTLHLEATQDGKAVDIELVATSKCLVSKLALAEFTPDSAWSLSSNSLSILRSWLSVRYNRASYPNEFVNRFDREGFAKLIKTTQKLLSFVYFDVDKGKAIERSDETPYSLKIILVFPPGDDPEETESQIEELATRIEALLSAKYFNSETLTWSGIELKDCLVISEDDLKVSQARKLTEWKFEHMTLKDEYKEQEFD